MALAETIYNNGDSYFEALLFAIEQAKTTIQLETYIFDQDVLGIKVLEALVSAATRKVRVQLLLDGVGSSIWTFKDAEKWRQQGIELKFFHALPWQKRRSFLFQSLSFKKLALGFFKLKHRNHRKTCTIDDTITFIGSLNVSARHLPSAYGLQAWRDTGARLQGCDMQRYIDSFAEAWNFSQQHYGHRWLKVSLQKRQLHQKIIRTISAAQKRIWITNPYFVPDLKLTLALCAVADRQIEVKILLPSRSDMIGIKFAMEGFYTLLLSFGIEIYEYTPSILHAKVIIVDDWVSMGSSNLDPQSIFYNLEIDAHLTEPESIKTIETQFLKDLEISKRIQFAAWNERSWFNKILEKFFLYFRKSL